MVDLYFNPVKIIETDDWQSVCLDYITKLKLNRPLILTSAGNEKRMSLTSFFHFTVVYSDINPNPTLDGLVEVIALCQHNTFDGIIAIGGGSVIDTAKVVKAALANNCFEIRKLFNIKDVFKKKIPLIAIPTTCGTGSEVTKWGTVWDMKNKLKLSISHRELYPDFAMLSPNLLLTLPFELTVITVLDALSHSLEAIWNKNRNEISSDYAIKAIKIIFDNIFHLKEGNLKPEVCRNLLKASNLAGLAFSNTKTAAAHSISYPLTMLYDIPHGIAASLTLTELFDLNKDCIVEDKQKLFLSLRISNDDQFTELIDKIFSFGGICNNLKGYGIKDTELEKILSLSFTKGRMDNNIRELTKKDVADILQSIY